MARKKHLLTDAEIRDLKAIRSRKTVTTDDADVLEAIYKRMNPKYELCKTCLDTLASEAMSLIGFAEKQIGMSLLSFEAEAVTEENIQTADPDEPEKTDEPAAEPAKAAAKAAAPAEDAPIVLTHEGINGMDNATLINYVFQETGVELSEHAERSELISAADDLLDDKVAEEAAVKIEVPKGGFGRMKNVDLIAYIKQETGTATTETDRGELIELAKKARKDAEN